MEPQILLFALCILLENVVNGHELKGFVLASGELPELLSLQLPVLLLDRVVDSEWRLRPGAQEGKDEALINAELLLEPRSDIKDEVKPKRTEYYFKLHRSILYRIQQYFVTLTFGQGLARQVSGMRL